MILNQKFNKGNPLILMLTFFAFIKNSYSLGIVNGDWGAPEFSRVITTIIASLTLVAVIMIIAGIFLENKPINFFGSWKFIVFFLAVGPCLRNGEKYINGWRGMNENLVYFWYDRSVESFFGANYDIKLFKPLRNNRNKEMSDWKNFYNTSLIDTTVLIILRIIGFGKKDWMKRLGKFGPLTFGVRLWSRLYLWCQQEAAVAKKNIGGYGYIRKWFPHTITWILWIVVIAILIEGLVRILLPLFFVVKAKIGESKNKKKDGDQVKIESEGENSKFYKLIYLIRRRYLQGRKTQ